MDRQRVQRCFRRQLIERSGTSILFAIFRILYRWRRGFNVTSRPTHVHFRAHAQLVCGQVTCKRVFNTFRTTSFNISPSR